MKIKCSLMVHYTISICMAVGSLRSWRLFFHPQHLPWAQLTLPTMNVLMLDSVGITSGGYVLHNFFGLLYTVLTSST